MRTGTRGDVAGSILLSLDLPSSIKQPSDIGRAHILIRIEARSTSLLAIDVRMMHNKQRSTWAYSGYQPALRLIVPKSPATQGGILR